MVANLANNFFLSWSSRRFWGVRQKVNPRDFLGLSGAFPSVSRFEAAEGSPPAFYLPIHSRCPIVAVRATPKPCLPGQTRRGRVTKLVRVTLVQDLVQAVGTEVSRPACGPSDLGSSIVFRLSCFHSSVFQIDYYDWSYLSFRNILTKGRSSENRYILKDLSQLADKPTRLILKEIPSIKHK